MDNLSASTLNELFVQKLNTPEGIDKVAQEGSAFVRQKLREISFARKVIQPQYVTKADLQRSVNHDGLVKIVDIEPDSKAMTVNFRGEPDFNYVEGERFEIPFFMISSEDFQKTEEELLAYEMPLTEVIEKNSVLDIQKIEDTSFLVQVDAAITTEASAQTGTYDTDGTVKKSDFKKLFDVLDGNELRAETLLMDSKMFNRLILYDDDVLGSLTGEVVVNGYTYATLFGRKLIVSNKVSLLDGKIYAFTSQDFMGQFLILNDTKFWIEKKKNIITFAAYESVGMGIGNTKSCAKITLS
jgi:hypothetical protein